MGLDSVELVIRFEDAFGISIPDEIAGTLTTPREVTNYIASQVMVANDYSCLSQQAFYFLRRGFVRRLPIQRNTFRPHASLNDFIPKRNRKAVWRGFQEEIGEAALPNLARPLWLFWLLVTLTLFIAAYSFYAMPQLPDDVRIFATMAILVSAGFILSFISRTLKTNFQKGFTTVSELVQHLIMHSPHCIKRDKRSWTRAQIAETIRAIIVDEIGITEFHEDSHFIKDMHID